MSLLVSSMRECLGTLVCSRGCGVGLWRGSADGFYASGGLRLGCSADAVMCWYHTEWLGDLDIGVPCCRKLVDSLVCLRRRRGGRRLMLPVEVISWVAFVWRSLRALTSDMSAIGLGIVVIL